MSLHHGLRATAFGAGDPYFANTVLLLRGDGTNGAQNNTFLDSSTNNFTITRNGNTTQGSFSPYWPDGRWSNYFDGSGDYITAVDNANLELGNSDFTIEGWVNFLALPSSTSSAAIISKWSSGNKSWLFGIYNNLGTYQLSFSYSSDGSTQIDVRQNVTISIGKWYHFAVTRNGTNIYLYANGSRLTPSNIVATLYNGTSTVDIGRSADSANHLTGYLSNVRLINGSAQYTGSSLTVPTTPLTAINNTSLLTCQSNRFLDNSSNAFTLTRNGDTAVSPFNPFPPVAEYSVTDNGGSGYFDGSGDYLDAPGGTAFDLGTTTEKDFTIEGWLWADGTQAGYAGIAGRGPTGSSRYIIGFASGGTTLAAYCDGLTPNLVAASATVTSDRAWHHFAFVRYGDVFKVYVDGVAGATTNTISTGISTSTAAFRVGTDPQSSTRAFKGFLCNLRVTKSAIYTANFTPPTTPLTAITNTQLLLNFTNGGIVDLTRCNNLETVGNAQVSTSVRKYGTGSLAFDGTDDWLQFPHMPFYNLTGDFTIESWVYLNSTTGRQNLFYKSENNTTGIVVVLNNGAAGQVSFYASNTGTTWPLQLNSTTNITANAWYHIACTRSGSTWTIWINGVSSGSTTNTLTPLSTTTPLKIGINRTAEKQPLNGYLDDYRVTAGVCRYSANFTPPTRQLAAR